MSIIPKPPKEGTKRYKEIVKRGCVGYRDEWLGDYDCEYGWECERCPVLLEEWKNDTDESERSRTINFKLL
jgi:hypothetical protein